MVGGSFDSVIWSFEIDKESLSLCGIASVLCINCLEWLSFCILVRIWLNRVSSLV